VGCDSKSNKSQFDLFQWRRSEHKFLLNNLIKKKKQSKKRDLPDFKGVKSPLISCFQFRPFERIVVICFFFNFSEKYFYIARWFFGIYLIKINRKKKLQEWFTKKMLILDFVKREQLHMYVNKSRASLTGNQWKQIIRSPCQHAQVNSGWEIIYLFLYLWNKNTSSLLEWKPLIHLKY